MDASPEVLRDSYRLGSTELDSSVSGGGPSESVPHSSTSSSASSSGSGAIELDFLFELCVKFVRCPGGGVGRPSYGCDDGKAWVERVLLSEATFKKRIGMSVASFERFYEHVRPLLRRAGDGMIGRPPTVVPRVRISVVNVLAGTRRFTACGL